MARINGHNINLAFLGGGGGGQIMRFKDITSYYLDGSLWDRINGRNNFEKFEDICVGDYFEMRNPITCIDSYRGEEGTKYVTIAALNHFSNDWNIETHDHIVCVPGKGKQFGHFGRQLMDLTEVGGTAHGYARSYMNTNIIGSRATTVVENPLTINQQLYKEFENHLLSTNELLSDSSSIEIYNRTGTKSGGANSWDLRDVQAVLLSEVEVYGSIVWSSTGYNTGYACHQLPLFREVPESLSYRSSIEVAGIWLKDVATAGNFCAIGARGQATHLKYNLEDNFVRPRFILG